MKKDIKKLLERAIDVQRHIAALKGLYHELDDITETLIDEGFTHHEFPALSVTLVDNFEDRYVVYRPAAVRRFELIIKEKEVKS